MGSPIARNTTSDFFKGAGSRNVDLERMAASITNLNRMVSHEFLSDLETHSLCSGNAAWLWHLSSALLSYVDFVTLNRE
jgi:hypothetical protein